MQEKEILAQLDNGDGISLQEYICPTHGLTQQLLIYNQGGHDCTTACIGCVAALTDLYRRYETEWVAYPHLKRFFRLRNGTLREVTMTDDDQAPPPANDYGTDAYYDSAFGSGEIESATLDSVEQELKTKATRPSENEMPPA